MSNYQVELIDKPAALTKEAIKSLRKQQVQGLSRRQLMRTATRHRHRAVAARGHRRHAGLRLAEPEGRLRRARSPIGDLDTIKLQNCTLPIEEGFPAYYPEARAFVILYDPGQQRFVAGEDTTGNGEALNVRALYQRCPHLGCKPNPCLKNFWFECPCHGSRYDRLGIKADGAAVRARAAEHGPLLDHGRLGRRPDHQHRQDHARAAPGRPRPARASSRRARRRAASDDRIARSRPPRGPMTDTPERRRARAAAARPPAAGRAGAGRAVHVAAVHPQRRAEPERAAQVVRQSSNARWVGFLAVVVVILFITVYWFYELAPLGFRRAAARRRGQHPAGHLGRARLQPVRGELRALPRRQRRGRRSGRRSTARTSCTRTCRSTT